MIQVRDGLAPIPKTSIMSYHMLMGKSESLKTLEECRHDKPKALEWQDDGNPVQAPMPIVGYAMRFIPDPFPAGGTRIC